jgi:hypothetical protein
MVQATVCTIANFDQNTFIEQAADCTATIVVLVLKLSKLAIVGANYFGLKAFGRHTFGQHTRHKKTGWPLSKLQVHGYVDQTLCLPKWLYNKSIQTKQKESES